MDEMENQEAEYFLQTSVIKSGVCDCRMRIFLGMYVNYNCFQRILKWQI